MRFGAIPDMLQMLFGYRHDDHRKCPTSFAAAVFNFVLFDGINPVQLAQEKEKNSIDQGFTGCFDFFY